MTEGIGEVWEISHEISNLVIVKLFELIIGMLRWEM